MADLYDEQKIDLKSLFSEAEQLFFSDKLEEAAAKFLALTKYHVIAPWCFYRLADIANKMGDPHTSQELYYRALTLRPDLYKDLLNEDHANHDFVFQNRRDEPRQEVCPLCGVPGQARWCYPVIEMGSSHVRGYNPVRVWMYCKKCHHMYAEHFPDKPHEWKPYSSPKSGSSAKWTASSHLFSYYSAILSKLTKYTDGNELFEIGIGGCECSLVAREMGLNVFGIEISEQVVLDARNIYGLNAEEHDFIEFETNRKWDIIIMGDVLEHVSDPIRAIQKAYEFLNDTGVLWISTPNFDSAFAQVMGHADAMRREASHRNYFSRISLFELLERFHFLPVEYQVSSHYNGSMEVTAVKE